VEIRADRLPPDSYLLRVFLDDHRYARTAIDLVTIAVTKDDQHAELWAAHGRLSPEAQTLIGFKLFELGFRHLDFYVLKGTKVTHYAEYVRSDDTFDYYTVDLAARIAEYLAKHGE
jgi:hypothetical protein